MVAFRHNAFRISTGDHRLRQGKSDSESGEQESACSTAAKEMNDILSVTRAKIAKRQRPLPLCLKRRVGQSGGTGTFRRGQSFEEALSAASVSGTWLGGEPPTEDFQVSALPTELPSRSGKSEKSNVEGRSEFRTPGCHYGGFSFVGKGRSTNSRGEERWREARCRFPERS